MIKFSMLFRNTYKGLGMTKMSLYFKDKCEGFEMSDDYNVTLFKDKCEGFFKLMLHNCFLFSLYLKILKSLSNW